MIEFLPETGSTSADLATRLRAGEFVPEGHWLVAARQTAGRGRQGRVWFDGSGNFMGSTVVHPGHGDPAASTLSLVTGLAVHAAAAQFVPAGCALVIKWPNDLMLGTAKLAGILLEREGPAVIVGIGVNIAVAPPVVGRETAALAAFGAPPSPEHFAQVLADAFATELERWRMAGLEPILRRWQVLAHPAGTPLVVNIPGEAPLSGAFAGLDGEGALQLRLDNGTRRTVHAGEVLFAPPPQG